MKGIMWWELNEVHLIETTTWKSWSGQIYEVTLSADVMIGWRLCGFTFRRVIWYVLSSESNSMNNSMHGSSGSRVNAYEMLKCDFNS